MLVLHWTSTIPLPSGRLLSFPIGVEDASLDAFGERLAREGGVMVDKLILDRRDDGCAYLVDEERVFISVAGTATVRNHDRPVLREID